MSKAEYVRLKREFARKNRLYPDQGRSTRPWEQPLREALQRELEQGLLAGEQWAGEERARHPEGWL